VEIADPNQFLQFPWDWLWWAASAAVGARGVEMEGEAGWTLGTRFPISWGITCRVAASKNWARPEPVRSSLSFQPTG
jgi:hypothetical protein